MKPTRQSLLRQSTKKPKKKASRTRPSHQIANINHNDPTSPLPNPFPYYKRLLSKDVVVYSCPKVGATALHNTSIFLSKRNAVESASSHLTEITSSLPSNQFEVCNTLTPLRLWARNVLLLLLRKRGWRGGFLSEEIHNCLFLIGTLGLIISTRLDPR